MKNYKVATVGTVLCGTLLFGGIGNVLAAGPIPADRNTDTTVKFVPNEDPSTPKDPENPEEPAEPENPDGSEPDPGTDGPLSLDYASSLDFGINVISTKDEVYNVKAQKMKDGRYTSNYAQVTDNRGTLEGWSLSVKQNGQFKSVTDGKELKGAQITFKDGNLNSMSESTKPGTVIPTLQLNPDGVGNETNVVVAGTGEGAGTWIYRLGDESHIKDATDKDGNVLDYKESDSITLEVPGKAEKMADSYKTTLTWTLTNTPANSDQ
ncbi:WxL domain-containing protein [Bacillus thuringiensis]|nr:WxL domain-containing protein [Bacillus thuringiensis]